MASGSSSPWIVEDPDEVKKVMRLVLGRNHPDFDEKALAMSFGFTTVWLLSLCIYAAGTFALLATTPDVTENT